MSNDCIFCKIASGTIPSSKIYEDTNILAFNDINPKAPVHVVVIPKKHIPTMNDVTEADSQLISELFQAMQRIAKKLGVAESGYRIVTNCQKEAGQEVFHLHFHILGGRPLKDLG
jgi:histidine triad (HIT) family protein